MAMWTYRCRQCKQTFKSNREQETVPDCWNCERPMQCLGRIVGSGADPKSDAPGGHKPNCWPYWSDAAGVSPSNRFREMERLRSLGCPAEINEWGQIKFESREHRKRVCEASGLVDWNAGDGDPQPSSERERIARGDYDATDDLEV